MEAAGAIAPDKADSLALFLKTLAEEGRALVAPGLLAEDKDALAVLRQYDDLARGELTLDAPAYCESAALWAARLLYQLCQFIVCRDLGEESIDAACRVPCPEPRRPETDWSVDLTLRHLPKLFQLARHLSQGDPLVREMRRLAAAWPLSSVGIPRLGHTSLESFIGHPALFRLYADRIVAADDGTRLGDPRVEDRLRADLGIHHELAPALAAMLYPKPNPNDAN